MTSNRYRIEVTTSQQLHHLVYWGFKIDTSLRDEASIAYSAAFLYGHEWTHVSFEIALFCLTDMLFRSFILAATVTYLVGLLLRKAAEFLTRRNLIVTSLVDGRFLI